MQASRNSKQMVKKLSGYSIAGLAFLCFGFFRYYKGSVIPYPFLWYILSIALLLFGSYLVTTSRSKKKVAAELESNERVNKLRSAGDKVIIDLDNCDLKENNYYNDVTNRGLSRADLRDQGYKEQYVEESVIIFYHRIGGKTEKFTSPIFPLNKILLSTYILNKKVILYIDRFDCGNYFFDIIS